MHDSTAVFFSHLPFIQTFQDTQLGFQSDRSVQSGPLSGIAVWWGGPAVAPRAGAAATRFLPQSQGGGPGNPACRPPPPTCLPASHPPLPLGAEPTTRTARQAHRGPEEHSQGMWGRKSQAADNLVRRGRSCPFRLPAAAWDHLASRARTDRCFSYAFSWKASTQGLH